MSAMLQGETAASNSFHARLVLAAGVSVTVNAPTLGALAATVTLLEQTEPANEAPGKSAATAPAGQPATQTAASSARNAAAQAAGDAGNASASTVTPANAQPAASGSAQAGEAGNANAAAQPAASSAPTASTEKPSDAPDFETVKKAFLALGAKAGGREKCEAVLKPFGLAKLSAAKPEQYAAVLAEIQKASA